VNTKISNSICVWASDFRENSGEGRLARLYVQKNLKCKYNNIKVISPDLNYIFINKKIYRKIKKKKLILIVIFINTFIPW